MAATQAAAGQAEYKGLICRGVEESGRLFIGQPGFRAHLVSLFVTGPNPRSASQTMAEHVAWVNDPLHSYVADGGGALCVWAHPSPRDPEGILGLPGLTAMEVQHSTGGPYRDRLWDEVLRGCVKAKRPFLWGYAADDTHSSTRINLSWYAARVPKADEFALKAALRQGALYVSNGPAIDDIAVRGRTLALRLPQEAEVVWLRAGQFLGGEKPAAELAVTRELGQDRCLKWDRGVRESSLDLDKLGVAMADLEFVRAVVRADPSRIAHTQPWRVYADGTIDNPYPASGTWVRGQTHNHTDTGPGAASRLGRFRLAYQAVGQLGSFSTDYSYWESPHQWLAGDGTPQVTSVTPDRVTQGRSVDLAVNGVNLRPGAVVQLGERPVEVLAASPDELRVRVPADLATGAHDVVVTNTDKRRGTLASGFSVQASDARNGGWRWFTTADGLSYLRTLCVACVRDEVWVGSIVGVSRFKDGAWTSHKRPIPGRGAYAIAFDPAGAAWIAGGGGLASCTADGAWSKVRVGQEEKMGRRRSSERWGRLARDAAGDLWVTNRWGAGLGVRRNGAWQRLVRKDGIPSDSASAAACDSDGVLWIGFSNGLHKRVDGKWVKVGLPKALTGCAYTSALAAGPDGAMWAAVTSGYDPAKGGVACVRAGKTVVYTPANSPLPSARIRDILVATGGDVWFASDLGVARLSAAGKWDMFTSVTSGLGCDIVLGLAQDHKGRIWFATARGVACYAPGVEEQ